MQQHQTGIFAKIFIENFSLTAIFSCAIFASSIIFYNALYNQPIRNYRAGDSIAEKIFTSDSKVVETTVQTRIISPKIDGLDNIIKKMVPKTPNPKTKQIVKYESETIAKIQAGLKNYGYDDIIIDGKQGEKTKTAIQRFQLEFNMKITGEADEQVLNKLKEIGAFNQT